ncbi:Zinc transporter zip1-like [Plakobranchus ocellatus]|uniref:Zinc transporter zip1-like n=1 Tax=Plakobranchus ocellatus TaxID=259542 RepID=A0AAV3Y239_9GAST|nr:Zinc transporter zip1-like [Plakobranchus ocellatus]
MEIYISKILTAVVLFILTMVFSLIPYFMLLRGSRSVVSSRQRDRVIAILNCLAGGVFLGTLLLHILSEGSEEFEEYKEKVGLKTEFPLFNLFVAGGFFLVAFVEFLAHNHLHHGSPQRFNTCDEDNATMHGPARGVHQPNDYVSEYHSQHQVPNGSYGAIGSSEVAQRQPGMFYQSESNVCTYQEADEKDSETVTILQKPILNHSPSRSGGQHDNHNRHPQGVQALLLLFALSFHTIFDGLAVGLQTSESEVWSVFGAITIHKSIIAFCLGLELFQTNQEKPWRAILWLLFFALMSPLGIGIGIELTSGHVNETAKLLASSILQGLAGGTFLYVTFLEILCLHVGHYGNGNFLHVFFVLLGFVIMAATKLLDND